MTFDIALSPLPKVTECYSVVRRTVWQVADPSCILLFAAKGRCQVVINNEEFLLEEGCVLWIPAGQYYLRRPVGTEFCTLYYAHLQPAKTGEKILPIEQFTKCPEERERLIALWEEAIAAGPPSDDRDLLWQINLSKILLLLARRVLQARRISDQIPPTADGKLRQALSYIHSHSKESITLGELCALCGYSKQHLIRLFRQELSTTPTSYMLTHRIGIAKALFLKHPELSTQQVAWELGFSDPHYFSRVFRRITGSTPREYRNYLQSFDESKQ